MAQDGECRLLANEIFKKAIILERQPMKKIVYFIMAGGEGMRLWPMSRSHFPKQLHSLLGSKSLLQQSIARVLKISRSQQGNAANILIGTRKDLYFSIKEQWHNLKIKNSPWLILEPLSRNTAPAIALAVLAARERFGEDVIMISLAADHMIKNQKRFAQLLKTGIMSAAIGNIVTFGIIPTYPETGYGYIKLGKKISANVFKVDQFKEKPNQTVAKKYLKSKKYLWNSGIFVFDTGVIADNLANFSPGVWKTAQNVWKKRKQKTDSVEFNENDFAKFPATSIDYAVMEKAPRRTVIKADFGWCDVGCWHMVHEVCAKDKNGGTHHALAR